MLARLSHFFIPHESNNFRAKALHHSSLSSLVALFLVFQLILSGMMILKPAILGFASQISPERVVELTNLERAKAGAPPLGLNSLLNESALRKSGDMFAFNYWAHNSPSGRSPWDFIKEVGYHYRLAGENLARDFSGPEAVVAAWMASPTHKENLLNPAYREIGIAVVDGSLGGVETTLVVQHFGTPTQTLVQVPAEAAAQSEPQTPAVQTEGAKLSPLPSKEGLNTVVEEEVVNEEVVSKENSISPSLVPNQALAQTTGSEKSLTLFNPFSLNRNLGLILFVILAGVLILDGILAQRKRAVRLTGRNLAHLIFLIGAFLILMATQQGAIL